MIALTGLSCSRTSCRELLRSLSQKIPLTTIQRALAKTGAREHRIRHLPSALVVQLVIALGLLVDVASRQVLGFLLVFPTQGPNRPFHFSQGPIQEKPR